MTSEPILKILLGRKIANIDSELIAGVLSSENQNKETFFLDLHTDPHPGSTSTSGVLGHYEAAQIATEERSF